MSESQADGKKYHLLNCENKIQYFMIKRRKDEKYDRKSVLVTCTSQLLFLYYSS